MTENRNEYTIFVWQPKWKTAPGRLKHRSKKCIKVDIKDTRYGGIEWIRTGRNMAGSGYLWTLLQWLNVLFSQTLQASSIKLQAMTISVLLMVARLRAVPTRERGTILGRGKNDRTALRPAQATIQWVMTGVSLSGIKAAGE
jgi:hypothetical protein